ncbi:MAG: EF-P lysine aminoacylase EpmA [Planctomycetota bacterium]
MSINLDHLKARAELLAKTRSLFDGHGFLEVQPPCLSQDCVVDAYLDPLRIATRQFGVGEFPSSDYFLQTSPESAMKRMLSEGAPSIYSLGPVFRAGEQGPLHNIEFTMLEWYEVEGTAESAIRLLSELARMAFNVEQVEQTTYRMLFQNLVGFDPLETPLTELQRQVAAIDRSLADAVHEDRDALLDVILSERISPKLGDEFPLIVTDYPLSQAALAKASASDSQCAARFELFFRGVEIANGYDELLDGDELARRAAANNVKRRACGREELAGALRLQHAMKRGLPQCSGVAVGFDRLLMLRVGEVSVESVMPFTIRYA